VYPVFYILAVMKNPTKERISVQTMILKALLLMSDSKFHLNIFRRMPSSGMWRRVELV
jgi:hypothetical protein